MLKLLIITPKLKMFISLIYNNKNNSITYLAKPFEQKLTKRLTGNIFSIPHMLQKK